jgi:NADP-dependent 3-hydroxy acid dehydrogenase YdfG/acyl carrier protein
MVWFPDCGMLELALFAGEQVGCDVVHELECESPLLLAREDAVYLQMVVGAPGPDGRRSLDIHSRVELQAERALLDEWTTHARGTLGAQAHGVLAENALVSHAQYPPPDAEPLDVEALHDVLASADLDLGSAFLGLSSAWRADGELVAQVDSPDGLDLKGYVVHPALLDAAIRPAATRLEEGDPVDPSQGDPQVWTPHIWRDVRWRMADHSSLRVKIVASSDGASSVELSDDRGRAVLSGSMLTRQLSRELRAQMGASSRSRSLFALDWRPFEARPRASEGRLFVLEVGGRREQAAAGAPQEKDEGLVHDLSTLLGAESSAWQPTEGQDGDARAAIDCLPGDLCERDTVLVDIRGAGGEVVESAHRIAANALVTLQGLLSDERGWSPRIGIVTRRALAVRAREEVSDLASSVVPGLVRAVQMENPSGLTLIDVDDEEASLLRIPAAVASEEPQVALRDGQAHRARLSRTRTPAASGRLFDPNRTVLITGGLTGLGALVARHLAGVHKVRSLVLAARSGPKAQHAEQLRRELRDLGAEVQILACDVSSRRQVAEVLEAIPDEMPLGGVVHSAAVLDDGILQSLTPDRLSAVLRPKVDGAWHLHELTSQTDLSAFVLFSSVAGVLGSPGQANYAAANAFLDALAAHRRSCGLPGVSIAWGRWEQTDVGSVALQAADLDRLSRLGIGPLSAEEGLSLFDIAAVGEDSPAVALSLDLPTVRSQARNGIVIPLLGDLVGAAAAAPEESGGRLAMRLEGIAHEEREDAVLQFVRAEIAVVMGRAVEEIGADVTFKDLGFDSLGAVDLRNRLSAASGLRLPATLVFSYPTPAALAGYLLREVRVSDPDADESAEAGLRRLEELLARTEPDAEEQMRIGSRLRALVAGLQPRDRGVHEDTVERIQAASTEELFELVEREWADEAVGAVNSVDGEEPS